MDSSQRQNQIDRSIAVHVSKSDGGPSTRPTSGQTTRGVTVKWVGGEVYFSDPSSAKMLVKRENLRTVSAAELRALMEQHRPVYDEASLSRPPCGMDHIEIAEWKRVARKQERFRSRERMATGWAWWARFVGVNRAATCAELLDMLHALADEYSAGWLHGTPIDWMERLRSAMADTEQTSVSSLRTAIRQALADDDLS